MEGSGPASQLAAAPPHWRLLPVRRVLFPSQVAAYAIGKRASVATIHQMLEKLGMSGGRLPEKARTREDALLAVVLLREKADAADGTPPVHEVATAARLVEVRTKQTELKAAGEAVYTIVVEGLFRLRLGEVLAPEPVLLTRATRLLDADAEPSVAAAYALSLALATQDLIKLSHPAVGGESLAALKAVAERIVSLGDAEYHVRARALCALVDALASVLDASAGEKQSVLACAAVDQRAELVVALIKRQMEVLKLSQKISAQVKGELSKSQREFYLRQQLKAIRDELGEVAHEAGDEQGEVAAMASKLREIGLPKEAEAVVERELKRLRQMVPQQAEYAVTMNHLEWISSMPWQLGTNDDLQLSKAEEVLEREHHGLPQVKQRVYEHLAVRSLTAGTSGSILCLIGPPGVGKTSIGRSIATALGRKFEQIALGGVSDASDIRGHRRTYVGAMPGLVVQALRRAKSRNPVILLDEIDKLCRDGRSDPSAALLEVLDPAQNCAFTDHYINTPFDLSNVLFVATANASATIPPALLDRMEILEISGYILEEKVQIAAKHLLPRQLRCNGLSPGALALPDETVAALAEGYTREAGVRGLERMIAAVCRSVAVKAVRLPEARRHEWPMTTVWPRDLQSILGPPKFEHETAGRLSRPGVAVGLAWTAVGGELLFIEATQMGGNGELILTGQIGEVMRESVRTALSWICTHAARFGLHGATAGTHLLKATDLHVHFPAAATPKDGPSAGVAVLVALVSLLSGRRSRADTAMTGEVTLRGHVLVVGGVREKVIAAHRAGIQRVILPAANKKDLHDVSPKALEQITFIFVRSVSEVFEHALLPLESKPTIEADGLEGAAVAVRDDDEGYMTSSQGALPLHRWLECAVDQSKSKL